MANKKKLILETAAILFAERGFNETSIAELAKLTRSAEGTIFYHFKTKNDIFINVLRDVREGIINEFNAYIDERDFDSGLEKTEKIISFFLYLAAHREVWFRLLQRRYPYENARMNDESREHLEAIYNTLIDFFEEALILGMEDGSIRTLSSRKIALILFSMVTGMIWIKFQEIYDTAILYEELLSSCRRILITDEN